MRTCYNNAAAESFFATLKKDLINRYRWPTRPDAHHMIFDFIERWYSNKPCTRLWDICHRPSTSNNY